MYEFNRDFAVSSFKDEETNIVQNIENLNIFLMHNTILQANVMLNLL